MTKIAHRRIDVDGIEMFYREAGDPANPALLLLHGFPTSSHMFRNLMPLLAANYYIVAPDMPGFGETELPAREMFDYSFHNLANVIERFVDVISLKSFGLYVFDYGAPVGLRVAMAHPERITSIISQNGNAYLEGLSGGWEPIQRYWSEPTNENRRALRELLTPSSIKWQYEHGVSDTTAISPDGITVDSYYMLRPEAADIQLDLFLDYASNVELYPEFQAYFRRYQPSFLAVWGDKDAFFLPPGAEAYKRDLPKAEIHFFDTGHFALETHASEIAATIRDFLKRSHVTDA